MDFVTPIITPIVQTLMVPIKKHLGFLVSSTKNVKDMDYKMNQLKDRAKDVKATLDRAVGNTEVVSELVEPWLEDVKKLNERSGNLKETIGCFNVSKRYKVGKQSYHILKEITDLENGDPKSKFTHVQIPLAEVGSTSTVPSTSAPVLTGTQIDFKSRDLIFNKALEALQSDESQKMIALCGMGGVGKTTMMEQLKKAVKDAKMFDSVVKVVIGENTDPISIQRAIAQYLGNDLAESAKDARADRLRKIFEAKSQGQKKVLVIMDDLWKEFDLADVGLSPLPNGLKLLFTSRFENECTKMGVGINSIFRVHVLDETEANNLFFKTLGPSPPDGGDAEFQRIGEQIVKKCGGLPIAIVTIAKILSGNIKEAWEKTLRRLEQDDLKDLEKITHRIFEMSYENLKEDDDRAIFLLCGLFPDDFDICTEDLLRYGWGLRFYKEVKSLVIARRDMKVSVNNLIRANLLTESDVNGCVKMHDLVRAFVLSNFSKVKQASIVNNESKLVHMHKQDAHNSYERILLKCTDICELPRDFNYSNLSLLILMKGEMLKLSEDIYERMENLKVMSYEKLGIPLLPVMFEHSIKLRTLRLRSCFLIDNDISFFGSLHNLEILSLVDCHIRRLPSTIGKLKKLKLLDLTGCIDLRIDDGVIQNLVSLEELYLRAVEGHVRFTHANYEELQKISQSLLGLVLEFIAWMPQKVMSFKKLERFEISIGCHLEKDYSNDYSFKNKLNLVATCNELKACNISDLFERTEELELEVNGMYYIEDISLNHTFYQLRVFHVSNCANLTCLFTPDVANGLKKLEQLTISKCPVLKALVSKNCGVGVITFQKLNVMSLEDLLEMATLFEGVIKLPELVELRLCGLPNITSIYHDNNSDMSAMQSLLNKEVIMPKLELLDISEMGNLKQIWPCEISTSEKNYISMLRQIRVRECDSLINLFPSNPLPLLNHLEELEVEKCGSIEVLFEVIMPKLELLDISSMENLKQIWPCEISNSEKNDVSMLRQIGVRECDSLINLFPSNPLPLLNHLEELEVENCGSIEVLFNIDFEYVTRMREYNSRLRSIKVENLGKINELWRMRGTNNSNILISGFKGVESIKITDCPKFTNIFTPITTNFDLGALTTFITDTVGCDVEESYRQKKLLAERDEMIIMTYPSYLLHTSHHLQRLQLENDKRVKEVVFEMHSHQPLLLPYLENLHLEGLKEMSHVWKCNWNKFFIHQHQLSFQNLTDIFLWSCPKLKYLFSPLMAKYLSNLKKIYIGYCDGIEEVISSRDDENEEITTSASSHQNTTFFPQLETLELNDLSCLKSIDGGNQTKSRSDTNSSDITNTIDHQSHQSGQVIGACWSLCQYPKQILIERCDVLSSLVPWYSVGQMKRLEELTIRRCKRMKEVLEIITTLFVPELTNLKDVSIIECRLLSHVFTFSTLESLNQLKKLSVINCKAIKVIIEKEENNRTSSKDAVVFPRLETLELEDLPNLEGFFFGMNEFLWPSLDYVMMHDCPQMMMFTSGQSITPKLKYIRTDLGKYSTVECGLNFHETINQTTFPASSSDSTVSKGMPWSFHNLIEINKRFDNNVGRSMIPSNVLLQLEKLEKIRLDRCTGVEEVFEVALEGSGLDESQTTTPLVQIPNLKQVYLHRVYDLKYLWKSNRSMVLKFPNLTTLYIQVCHQLEHVFTCSMVGSLVQLQDLLIYDCKNIEVIVKEEEEECDIANVKESIKLPCLKSLRLDYLPRLKGFCLGKDAFSLPALDTLKISRCPKITIFTRGDLSTPNLKVTNTDFGIFAINEDLNSVIETNQQEDSSSEDDALLIEIIELDSA